jgi:hypothetical protein
MTIPAGTPDEGTRLFYPGHAAAVDVSSADFDCTQAFAVGYATSLYVGAAGDVAIVHFGDTVAVTYKAVPVGTTLTGCFKTIKHTNSSPGTLMIARSL